ncbi:Protein THYLAKOID FORMATION 1, chloroplastic [Turnera subulata]|uniref:Protein THYLAKOID FORMATION 1, chloroplastic n=1 Tax=Turnera subulata TaxID=218843 RepID=A0A9Q0GCU7_9ROSI|nr:Protein THYLAKOID FORMATION 1, chloroplastic [Turnera subulata]
MAAAAAAAAAVTSVSFSALSQASFASLTRSSASTPETGAGFRLRSSFSCRLVGARSPNPTSRLVVQCMCATTDVPTVAETKFNFLKAYKKPIPSIYNTVLQELIVQQHLMRYKRTYSYDAVFGLGFVTVFDQLMEGYPSDEDKDAIFKAYVEALNEEPEQYRTDAAKLEEWAKTQTSSSLVEFASREGEVEGILKDIAGRAASGKFSYSRFFAVGLFRLLELTSATEPTILEKLCAALNINKRSVDRDLDVYRNLLSKLVQAKELLKEYVDREKKKREERAETQKANEAVKNCLGEPQYVR